MRTLLSLAFFALLGCSSAEQPCSSDSDCPTNYRCDLEKFAGECIQTVYVIRCGPSYCEHPYERCVNRQCVSADQGEGGQAVSDSEVSTPDLGFGGQSTDDSGSGSFDEGVDPEDAYIDYPTPTVTIEAPFDQSILIDTAPVISGQVFSLAPAGRVRAVVDGAEPGETLSVSADGRFQQTLNLQSGQHRVVVVAEQGDKRGEATVSFRLDYFVSVRQGEFVVGSRTFRFVGLNMPNLLEMAADFNQNGGVDRVDEAFRKARQLGVTVVRTRAYDDRPGAPSAIQLSRGTYGAVGLAALDTVIARAGQHGIKLILPLVDGTSAYGGPTQYLKWAGYVAPIPSDLRQFYVEGAVRTHFEEHVRTLVSRTNSVTHTSYREEPAILAWEIIDRPDPQGLFGEATGVEMTAFFTTMAGIIKGLDRHHLVTTGEVGYDLSAQTYREAGTQLTQAGLTGLLDGTHHLAWQRNLRIESVGFASIHVDPALLGFPADGTQQANLGAAWIRGHASLAAVEGKPLVILQARQNNALDLSNRRQILQAWFDEVLSLDAAGVIPGNFYPEGVTSGDDPSAWGFQEGTTPDAPANQYADQVSGLAQTLNP